MKRAAVLGLSALLLVLAGAIVLPSFIDWNKYRDNIASALEDATGRQISVGALTFRLLPQPTLRAAGVTVANIEGGKADYFAQVKALDVRMAFLPLLTGDVRIESVALLQPRIVLETLPDGRHNWQFGSGDGEAAARIRIDDLTAEDGTVTYLFADGKSHEVTDVEASLTARSLNGPVKGTAQARYDDAPLAFDFSVGNMSKRNEDIPIDLTAQLVDADAKVAFTGGYRESDDSVSVGGSLNVNGKSLSSAAVALANLMGRPPARLPQSAFAVTASVSGPIDTMRLTDLTLAIDGEAFNGKGLLAFAKGPTISLGLATSRFNLDKILQHMPASPAPQAKLATGKTSTGQGATGFSLPQGVAAKLTLDANAVDYRGAIMRQAHLAAGLTGGVLTLDKASAVLPGGSDIIVAGRVKVTDGQRAFDGDVTLNASNLRALLTWAGADVSAIPEGRLVQSNFTSHVNLQGDRLTLAKVDMGLDSTRAQGKATVTLGAKPEIAANIALDRLAVDAYLAENKSDHALPAFPILADFNADLTLSADRLSYGRSVLNSVKSHMTLKDTTLTVDDFSVDQWGGARFAASGTLSALASDATADLSLEAAGDHADRFLEATGLMRPEDSRLLGTFAVNATLKGDVKKTTMTADGAIGDSDVHIKGDLLNLSTQPAAQVTIDATNQSLAQLAEQFGVTLSAPQARGMAVTVSGHINGSAVQGSSDAKITVGSGDISFTARYAQSQDGRTYRVDLKGHQDDPVPLLRALGLEYQPAGPIPATDFDVTVNGQPATTQVENLRLAIGKTQLNGTATLDRAGERPKLTANLQGTDLALDPLLPADDAGIARVLAVKGQSAAAKARARWSHRRFDWSLIRDYDADIRLTAQSIRYGPYTLSGPVVTISAKDGVMRMDPLSGGIFGGTTTLRIIADARQTPHLSAQADLANIAADQASKAIFGNSLATGSLTVKGAFDAQSTNEAGMIAGLSGDVDVSAENGTLKGIDLAGLSKALTTLDSLDAVRTAMRRTLSSGETPFSKLTGHVAINQGIATADMVKAEMADAKAELGLTLDLPNWTIAARGSFDMVQPAAAPPVTVTLSGAIDAPSRQVDSAGLDRFAENRVGTAVLQRAIGNQEGGFNALLGRGQGEGGGGASPPATQ